MVLNRFLLTITIVSTLLASCTKREDEVAPIDSPTSSRPAPSQGTPSDNGSGSTDGNVCPSGTAGEAVEGQYIVLFKDEGISVNQFGTDEAATSFYKTKSAQLLEKYGLQEKERIKHVFSRGVCGFTARISDIKARALQDDPEILSIEQDRFIALEPVNINASADSAAQIIPYGIKRVGGGKTASAKTAWVLDTGIDPTHPDLNVDKNRSRSFVCSEPSTNDQNGHGTHVAGTIAAKNNNIGVVGVAPGNTVVGVKVMGADGKGTVSNLIAGLDYVYKYGSPGDVVNMSLSGGLSPTLDKFVTKIANEKKIIFVLAAGNDSKDAMNLSPQRVAHPNIITVSAMDNKDTYASFSNFGDCVDYCAPGVRIASTYPGGKYVYMSGTSMAAPHVAGMMLLSGQYLLTDGTVLNDPDGKPDPIAVLVAPSKAIQ